MLGDDADLEWTLFRDLSENTLNKSVYLGGVLNPVVDCKPAPVVLVAEKEEKGEVDILGIQCSCGIHCHST